MEKKKVMMLGSFVVDLTTRQKGLPVPGETIVGDSFKMGPGGKGSNQAVVAHRAGADVTLVTKLGRDLFGNVATDFYKAEGMDISHVLFDDERTTGIALIEVDTVSAQNSIVVVPAACANFTEAEIEGLRPLIRESDYLLMQLEINMDATFRAMQIAKEYGVPVILNPAPVPKEPVPDELLCLADVITPNEFEAQALTGVRIENENDARTAAKIFHEKGVKNVVITLGALGVFASNGKKDVMEPRLNVNAIDTTGAGDAFSGGFTMALSEGKDLFTAVRCGNVTGALAVTRLGTAPAMPRREEILAFYKESYGVDFENA